MQLCSFAPPCPSLLLKITGKPNKICFNQEISKCCVCQTSLFSGRLCSVALTMKFFFCNLFMQPPNFLLRFLNFQFFRPWLNAIRFLLVFCLYCLISFQLSRCYSSSSFLPHLFNVSIYCHLMVDSGKLSTFNVLKFSGSIKMKIL